jgi:hypothetical protein
MKAPSIVPIIGLAIINGIFSPVLVLVFALQGLWYPFFLPASVALVFAFSSLVLSTVYLMVSGVPAAIYERFIGKGQTSLASRLIWLVAMALLTIPAVPNVMKAMGIN